MGIQITCSKCDNEDVYYGDDTPSDPYICPLCTWLGDRSLTWVMKAFSTATTKEERAVIYERFAAARGRSMQWSDVVACINRGDKLPPGILQREKEKAAAPKKRPRIIVPEGWEP